MKQYALSCIAAIALTALYAYNMQEACLSRNKEDSFLSAPVSDKVEGIAELLSFC